MKLTNAKITEFHSIRDSNEFELSDITCLVGKNEAGKTAILQALYRLNPVIKVDGKYDITDDFPRTDVEDYKQDIETGVRKHANVVQASFLLEEEDLRPIYEALGENSIAEPKLTLFKGYGDEDESFRFSLSVNENEILNYIFKTAQLPADLVTKLSAESSVESALEILESAEQTTEVERLVGILTAIKKRGCGGYVYDTFLQNRVPKFLYFDEYYQMRGFENIEKLMERKETNTLEPSDYPMLGLIELARLDLDSIITPDRTQELRNKLEGAGNFLTKKVIKYWSQNKHIQMRFDVRPARPNDPTGMTAGTNIWADIYDSRHMVTTSVGTRSRGFIWFFSFLAWYSQVRKEQESVILLLDEPGLSLHAKAQEDLLRYFEEEVKGVHQLVYSTHSPFMVDSQHFDRVRIVQDQGIDSQEPLPIQDDGTKVLTDVFEASNDSLFPLQGALGYEIYQTLFVGPNSLIVEGVSDLLYLQVMSSILETNGREGLSPKWTITPVGGSDKVPTFVSLVGSQKGLKIATLIDVQSKDLQSIENLYKKRLLNKKNVITFAEFTKTKEADIEDMFDHDFYLELVNAEFKSSLQKSIAEKDLLHKHPRILVRLEEYLKQNPMKGDMGLNHFRPARFLSENVKDLANKLSSETLGRFEQAFKQLNSLL